MWEPLVTEDSTEGLKTVGEGVRSSLSELASYSPSPAKSTSPSRSTSSSTSSPCFLSSSARGEVDLAFQVFLMSRSVLPN